MEPITAIVTALALGATAGLSETAKQAVKDAYATLKELIQRRYSKVNLPQLEEAPESKARQAVIEEDLTKAGADRDEDLFRAARAMLEAVRADAPEAAGSIGVDLEQIKGASLRISDVIANGTGVKAKHAEMSGDIEIKHIRAGQQGDASKNL